MAFGRSVTTFLADFYPTDPIEPQVLSDFAKALPPSPIKGATVSDAAHITQPSPPPIHPTDIGSDLSEYISAFRDVGPGLGDGFLV